MFDDFFSPLKQANKWISLSIDLGLRAQHLNWSWWQEFSKNSDMDPFGLREAYSALVQSWWREPRSVWAAQHEYWRDWSALVHHTTSRYMGQLSEPVIEPHPEDRRFRDIAWRCPVFAHMQQSYLLFGRLVDQLMNTKTTGLEDDQSAVKLEFFKTQWLDALSPGNFAVSNPVVWQTAIETRGASLQQGLGNLLADLSGGKGRITMADPDAFVLGKNIACTPGKIIFQNRLLQLIQYLPSSKQVYRRPLLVVPPWINKYYILDLQPANSFVNWLVSQGHTVFMISWVNPDSSYAETTFEDYIVEGVLPALDAVAQVTGNEGVNTIGYCIGGTLLACALAVLSARDVRKVASATFFTTLLDFSEPGEIKVFIDEEQIRALEHRMQSKGYLDGDLMGTAFSLLRSNDLVWSFVINNYLLGKQPPAFDLLHWNADSTRMPAAMHSYYLRNMYLHNLLSEPGALVLADTAIDLGKIDVPCYFLSAKDDHIAPWASTYSGARLISGRVRFVLGDSGHIAGVVNPPAKQKYGYWSRDLRANLPAQAGTWFRESEYSEGSWWPDWHNWISGLDDGKVAARQPGDGPLEVVEDAPGRYAAVTI